MPEPVTEGAGGAPERSSLLAALATATVMIAHQVAGKATRDALERHGGLWFTDEVFVIRRNATP